jgi:lactoylglutathione lyase
MTVTITFAALLTGTAAIVGSSVAIDSSVAIESSIAARPHRPQILGVAHMAIYAKDLAKTRRFYEDFLGFGEPLTLPAKTEPGVRIAFVKVNAGARFVRPRRDARLGTRYKDIKCLTRLYPS